MSKSKTLTGNILLLVIVIIAVMVCYYFIDKPVAIWISHHKTFAIKFLKYFVKVPECFIALVPFIYLYVVFKFYRGDLSQVDSKFLMFANGIGITGFLKEIFKFIFGRYWPETWAYDNPSLIKHNMYGFHWFHSGIHYCAFPSGHAAVLMAGITMLWLLYPRLWPLYLLVTILSLLGILGMNYHFISDLLAGMTLGYLVSLHTFLLSGFAVSKTQKTLYNQHAS